MQRTSFDKDSEKRLRGYLDAIGETLRDKRQRATFALYAVGLLSEGDRKSMEPIAARLCGDPKKTNAMHHKLMHFLGTKAWRDEPIRRIAAHYAICAMQKQEPIKSWVVDDTGFIKSGDKSPGVQRQYTGSAGKRTNCQIGVSLTIATSQTQVPIDIRLYIPQSWADDRPRCREAHIPDDVGYKPKWKLALEMIEEATKSGIPQALVLADAGYGNTSAFRQGLDSLKLEYAVDVHSPTTVRRVGFGDVLEEKLSVKELARKLRSRQRRFEWRDGTRRPMRSRFARVRVVADTNEDGGDGKHLWLLIEWPVEKDDPTSYVLSTLPKKTPCKKMINAVKNRWRIEQSYRDLKGELGLDHYEGRSFIGWHHHITVALTCYAFLVAERVRSFPPSATRSSADSALGYAA